MIRAALVALAAMAGLAGCVAPAVEPAGPAAVTTTFLCERSQSFTVTLAGATGELRLPGAAPLALQRQVVASGVHYTGGGHDLRGSGDQMTWTEPGGQVQQCLDQRVSMQRPQIQEPMADLAGTTWVLVQFQSSDDAIGILVPPRRERYTLAFNADGTLAMQLDCNRANARWTASSVTARGGALSLAPGAMTRAMCGQGAMDTRIAQDFARVRSYTLERGQLHLALEADGGIYTWERGGGSNT
jgi:heat shock protein HslJ